MLGRTYENENCSAARALEVVGERWSLLIVRDAMLRGTTKFSEFQRNLGLAPNILASRLDAFVQVGLMRARRYSEHPDHREYVLTRKGLDLQPLIIALTAWGDRWAAGSPNSRGRPMSFRAHLKKKSGSRSSGPLPERHMLKRRPPRRHASKMSRPSAKPASAPTRR